MNGLLYLTLMTTYKIGFNIIFIFKMRDSLREPNLSTLYLLCVCCLQSLCAKSQGLSIDLIPAYLMGMTLLNLHNSVKNLLSHS